MSDSHWKMLLGTAFLSLTMGGAAWAGGFSRGTADTDILYEDGNFNMRSGVTYVSPHREFTKNPNPKLVGTNYTEDYAIPSAAIKFNLADNLRCAGTYVQNNGGSTKYDFPTASGKVLEEFTTYEAAATCAVSFDLGRGKFWLLGGGYSESLDYLRKDDYTGANLGPLGVISAGQATLDLGGQKYGYRIGAAYEIPEMALRGQIIYRSGTSYGATGTATAPAGVLAAALNKQAPGAPNPFLGRPINYPVTLDAVGMGKLPQSLDFRFQTGIAPGWLAFGSVKWTDWSKMTQLRVVSAIGGYTITRNDYYWKDGWTVTGGVAHKFNDTVSGLASLTWDRGVSTGYDLMGDAYTAALGVSLKDKLGGELRGGVAFSYLASAAETKYGLDPNVTDTGDQAVKAGYAVAFNLGYNIKW
jgi:long-chain fatty acid transport protein